MEITMSDTRYSKDHEWVRRDGDTVTIELERVGTLTNPVASA